MEFDRIRNLLAPIATSEGALGLRDDVAMLEARPGAIVTTDALVEAVHFLPSDPVNLVARKLVRVNVSDILAKGAAPVEALLTVGWPQTRPEHEFSDFVDGLADELSFWSINLIGGDSVKSPGGLFLSMTLTGHPLRQAPVLRSGAGVADDIYVTGEIGWGWLGLQAALRGDAEPGAIDHYRVPQLAGRDAAKLVAAHA
ncbi:MAG: thiamine-phosphate kinase, partial [Pseudomonadota bacterium]